jgi:hypothetical protein
MLNLPRFISFLLYNTDCICRRCESEFKRSFFKFKAGEPDEASDAKRACTDNEDNKIYLQILV